MTLPDHIVGNHRAMMDSPNYWQRWPLLPIKRDRHRWPDSEVGVLLDRRPIKVYLCNMWAIPEDTREGTPSIEYASIDAVLADGWIVD